jgi:hypothetical protein
MDAGYRGSLDRCCRGIENKPCHFSDFSDRWEIDTLYYGILCGFLMRATANDVT